MGLFEVFQEMQKHVSQYGNLSFGTVKQQFGKIHLNDISSYPHAVWVPTSDQYGYPDHAALPQIIGGKQVHLESFETRRAGCDVHLFHRDYASMETFINDFHNAIYDVAPSLSTAGNIGNLEFGSGQWEDREGIKDNSVKYIQSLYISVPIYRLLPAAIAQSVTVAVG